MFPYLWPIDMSRFGADGTFQNIAPQTSWFSPTYVTYKGTPEIERRVATEIASNGKQLGIITEALLEVAGTAKGPALDRLREMAARIEEIKTRTRAELKADARDTLERLADKDPAAARGLAEQILRDLGPARPV